MSFWVQDQRQACSGLSAVVLIKWGREVSNLGSRATLIRQYIYGLRYEELVPLEIILQSFCRIFGLNSIPRMVFNTYSIILLEMGSYPDRKASSVEIKKAYRHIMAKYHPDRNAGSEVAIAMFKAAAEAYEVLGDENIRARYDILLTLDELKERLSAAQKAEPKAQKSEKTSKENEQSPAKRETGKSKDSPGTNSDSRKNVYRSIDAIFASALAAEGFFCLAGCMAQRPYSGILEAAVYLNLSVALGGGLLREAWKHTMRARQILFCASRDVSRGINFHLDGFRGSNEAATFSGEFPSSLS